MSSDWQEISLIKALDVNPAVKMQKGDVYPFVDMQSIETGNKYVVVSQEREFKGSGSRFIDGDTLMARITPCLENGKISRYRSVDGSPAHGSTEFIVLRHRKGVTHPEYVYYLTISDQVKPYAIAQMTGSSGRQRVQVNSFKHLTINLPPLPEQQAISEILKTLDDKIELNRQMFETLEKTASTLFKSWFVDFDPVKAKMEGRVPEGMEPELLDLFPDSFEESDLGPIPAAWEVKQLDSEFDLLMGQSPPGDTYNEEQDGIPFFQGTRDFGFRYPSNRVWCSAPTRIANSGDALVSVRAPVGDVNMALEKICIGRGVAAVRHKTKARSYTYYYMKSLGNSFKIYEAGGTVFGSINKTDFSKMKVLGFKPEVLSEFEKICSPMDEKIEDLSLQISSLTMMRDNLLPKLISGELRVEDVGGV